ncbi:MAG: hypothetical protein HY909_29035 [Deltaproteobacteria bacterium]|nr:hypothetical protein [Deltaproteobacteria bacterium]
MRIVSTITLMALSSWPGEVLAQGAGNIAERVMIDATVFPAARCNDGSAPRYSYALASRTTRKWLIFLQGGASCHDEDTCANRWFDIDHPRIGALNDPEIGNHRNMVNADSPRDYTGRGVVDFRTHYGVNPFQDMNRLYVHYCSSDLWSGHGGTQVPGATFAARWQSIVAYGGAQRFDYLEPPPVLYFSGADIVTAIVDIIKTGTFKGGGSGAIDDSTRPNDASAEVVLAGSSAGAFGVASNLDRVARRFRDPSATGPLPGGLVIPPGVPEVVVYGVMDSADPAGASPEALVAAHSTTDSATYWGGGDRHNTEVDASCVDSQVRAGGDPDRCFDTGFVLRDHLQTPYFVAENSYDPVIHGGAFAGRRIVYLALYLAGGMSLAEASIQATVRAIADLRSGVTRATASFGVVQGNTPGLYIPNYHDDQFANGDPVGVHQLMAATDWFWNSPSALVPGLPSPNLTLRAASRPDQRSFASALRCFRAARAAPRTVLTDCAHSGTIDDMRVVNERYR